MSNVNYVDLVVFIILVIEIIKGVRSGIIVPLFDIAGVIFGWIIAKANALNFAPTIDKFIHITPYISSKVKDAVKLPSVIATAPATKQNITSALSVLRLPSFIQNFILNSVKPNQSFTVQQYIVHSIAFTVLIGISFITLFILVLIIFRIVGVFVRNGIRVSPFLKWVDAFFGALFRLLIAFSVLYIIAEVIVVSAGYFNAGNTGFIHQVEVSKFYQIGSTLLPFLKDKIIQIITPVLK